MGVSVIIPAYNAGTLVEDALASVLSQETPADEIIIVNDGSTDRDYAELERLHRSIRVIQQTNRGVSAARNAGCDAATHDYLAILDADDIWLPGKLRDQMHLLAQNPAIDAVFCLGREWTPSPGGSLPVGSDSGARKASPPETTRLYYSDFLCSFAVYPSTMVVKRSAWKSIGGYDESRRYGEDWDFYLRLSHNHQTALVNRIAMLYRHHPASATAVIQQRNHWAEVLENAVGTLGLVDAFGHKVDEADLKRHLYMVHFTHGHHHFWSGSYQIAQREFAQARRMSSATSKAMAYLALSHAPGIRSLVRRSRLLWEGR